ncbi:MAG: leucyl/phenylalanyl-tRNA--protein transferase [Thalassotalea sp.]
MSQVIYQLESDNLTFPSPDLALTDPNGLLAFDGDLSIERLLSAYQSGIFPWYSEGDPIMWWSPNPRAIIPTDSIVINKTLRKFLKRNPYTVTINQAFEQTISYCADAPFRKEGTWILDEMKAAYCHLHANGHAHSIEVWQGDELVGGLYGIAINGYFSGESMFYKASNASKVALLALCQLLKQQHVKFIDCQLQNDFLASMGCVEIPRTKFLTLHREACTRKMPTELWLPGPFHFR